MTGPVSPRDLQDSAGGTQLPGQPADDSQTEAAIAGLADASAAFVDASSPDAAAVVDAAGRVHDLLQRRLSEAQT